MTGCEVANIVRVPQCPIMQITCPSCGTVYSVPDEKLMGRAVKCARCGTKWSPLPDPPAFGTHSQPTPKPPPEPPPEPVPPRVPLMISDAASPKPEPQWPFVSGTVLPPPPEPRSKGLLMAWVASIALLLAVVAGAYAKRDNVMQAWPPSQRVYGLFGFR
jgi:predicted Zn finger-like uncharacterized protein